MSNLPEPSGKGGFMQDHELGTTDESQHPAVAPVNVEPLVSEFLREINKEVGPVLCVVNVKDGNCSHFPSVSI